MKNISEDNLREIGKLLNIGNYWNLTLDNLTLKIKDRLQIDDQITVEYSQLSDTLGKNQRERIDQVFDAYNYFNSPSTKPFVQFVDDSLISISGKNNSVSIDVLFNKYKFYSRSITVPFFQTMCEKVCFIFSNLGWKIEGDLIMIGDRPILKLKRHLELYKDMQKVVEQDRAYEVFEKLLS